LQDAQLYRSGAYHAIKNVQDMKACFASGYGFIAGFSAYDSFESNKTAASGLMPVPNLQTESLLGGHEVFFMGTTMQCPGATQSAHSRSKIAGELPGASPASSGSSTNAPQITPS
jgi:hypothetical protein